MSKLAPIFSLSLLSLVALTSCSSPASSETYSNTELTELVAVGDVQKLTEIKLEKPDALNMLYRNSYSLYHVAIISPTPKEVISILFEAGVDINIADREGRTPLHHAIDANNADAAVSLVAHGARTDISDRIQSVKEMCKIALRDIPKHKACLAIEDLKAE